MADPPNMDRYLRAVPVVRHGNRDINREMVREGLALAYRRYLDRPHASEYIGERSRAEGKAGIVGTAQSLPLWEFRKMLEKGNDR